MYLPVATKVRSYCWPGVAGHLATWENQYSHFALCRGLCRTQPAAPVVLLESPLQSMRDQSSYKAKPRTAASPGDR